MSIVLAFIIWYAKPTSCYEGLLNDLQRCRINFPDQVSLGYQLCESEAWGGFERCVNGWQKYDGSLPENP